MAKRGKSRDCMSDVRAHSMQQEKYINVCTHPITTFFNLKSSVCVFRLSLIRSYICSLDKVPARSLSIFFKASSASSSSPSPSISHTLADLESRSPSLEVDRVDLADLERSFSLEKETADMIQCFQKAMIQRATLSSLIEVISWLWWIDCSFVEFWGSADCRLRKAGAWMGKPQDTFKLPFWMNTFSNKLIAVQKTHVRRLMTMIGLNDYKYFPGWPGQVHDGSVLMSIVQAQEESIWTKLKSH